MPGNGELHRDLPFLYRCWRPAEGDGGPPLILLHGSGVDETTTAALSVNG